MGRTETMGIKRFITNAALCLLMFSAAQAQEVKTDSLQELSNQLQEIKSRLDSDNAKQLTDNIWKRKKYMKIAYCNPHIERTDGVPMAWKTQFAIALQQGRTVYFHRKPIAGMLKFGLDYGFGDLSYAKLKLNTDGTSSMAPATPGAGTGGGFDEIVSDDPSSSPLSMLGVNLGMHKFEYGIHVGPSISVNPWNHIIVAAYFHATPTASGILENESFSYGFGCAMSAGVSVSYKLISVGVEGMWSNIKYRQASFSDSDDDDDDGPNLFDTKKFKLKQKGPRFYIAFRF